MLLPPRHTHSPVCPVAGRPTNSVNSAAMQQSSGPVNRAVAREFNMADRSEDRGLNTRESPRAKNQLKSQLSKQVNYVSRWIFEGEYSSSIAPA